MTTKQADLFPIFYQLTDQDCQGLSTCLGIRYSKTEGGNGLLERIIDAQINSTRLIDALQLVGRFDLAKRLQGKTIVYASRNPTEDGKLQALIDRVSKLEDRINFLEEYIQTHDINPSHSSSGGGAAAAATAQPHPPAYADLTYPHFDNDSSHLISQKIVPLAMAFNTSRNAFIAVTIYLGRTVTTETPIGWLSGLAKQLCQIGQLRRAIFDCYQTCLRCKGETDIDSVCLKKCWEEVAKL